MYPDVSDHNNLGLLKKSASQNQTITKSDYFLRTNEGLTGYTCKYVRWMLFSLFKIYHQYCILINY